MNKNICLIYLVMFLFCTSCTVNYVCQSSNVDIDARKDIQVTDPSTTIGLPVL